MLLCPPPPRASAEPGLLSPPGRLAALHAACSCAGTAAPRAAALQQPECSPPAAVQLCPTRSVAGLPGVRAEPRGGPHWARRSTAQGSSALWGPGPAGSGGSPELHAGEQAGSRAAGGAEAVPQAPPRMTKGSDQGRVLRERVCPVGRVSVGGRLSQHAAPLTKDPAHPLCRSGCNYCNSMAPPTHCKAPPSTHKAPPTTRWPFPPHFPAWQTSPHPNFPPCPGPKDSSAPLIFHGGHLGGVAGAYLQLRRSSPPLTWGARGTDPVPRVPLALLSSLPFNTTPCS